MKRSDFLNPNGVWPADEFASLFATIPSDIAMPSDPFEANDETKGDPDAIADVRAYMAKLRNPAEAAD